MAINRAAPTASVDSTAVATPTRTGRYGEAYTASITNKEMFAADEGSHYVAVNPTMGTGILGHAAPTTFDETKPFLTVYNGGSNRIYLQSLLLTDTVVSVGGTRIQFTMTIDNTNLVSSGGTALVKANVNYDSTTTSGATITAGAVVCAAAGANRRLLGNYVIKGANIDVVWDEFEFIFGTPGGSTGGLLTPTTVATHFTRYVPPVVVGPGQIFKLHQWAASQSTGPTCEVILSYIER